ncbi:MAG: response regulator transcription factor [Clostridiaceae bacterium]|nr:response regulator transcription factor [Clostridiaceae bacterium]MDD6273411.1 response regulator [Clostridiaceae bacterium]
MAKILVVEDEKAIADIVAFNLMREGYEVLTAYDGLEGLEHALHAGVDLILLDVMLPGMDGFEICRRVREKSNVPIIMLTAREEETDKVLGLEIGADDYITKPFSMRELMARIHANLRRTVSEPQPPVQQASSADLVCGEIEVFFDAHEIRCRGKVLDLTAREYEILRYMASNANRVIPREELMEKVWGYEYYGDLRAVDVAICRVRDKVEKDPSNPQYIITRRGVGYLFSTEN